MPVALVSALLEVLKKRVPKWLTWIGIVAAFAVAAYTGFLLGVEQGSGFVIARWEASVCHALASVWKPSRLEVGRDPAASHAAHHSRQLELIPVRTSKRSMLGAACRVLHWPFNCRPRRLGDAMSNRWSAPAFVKVTGVEFGLVGGMDRVS